jgi:multidrug efflux pump
MLCSRVLRVPESHGRVFQWSERFFGLVDRSYQWLLGKAFQHRGMTILAGLGAFALGMVAFTGLSKEFAPVEDRSSFMLIFETPRGSTLSETDALARQVEAELAAMEEIQHQFLAIGLAQGGGPGTPHRGMAFVRMVPRGQRERHQVEVMQELRERLNRLPAGRAFVTEITIGGIGGSPVEVVLQHRNLDELARQQEAVITWMEAQPEWFVGVRTNLELNNPEVTVSIDRDSASQAGVSVADISNTMRLLFGGAEISKIEIDTDRYDVITDVVGRGRLGPDVLRDIYVRGAGGELVSLDNLVHIEETIGPSEIHRFNRLRSATISSQTPPGVAVGDAVDRLEAYLAATLPADADYELAGLSQIFEESFYYLTIAIVFSIVFIYLILAAQFESFVHPFTIMLALPLATVGAFGGLWMLGITLTVYAFIGLIMLMGLVTKNAILLVDYANVLVGRGRSPMEAARESATVRFRPVVMTATSTVLGIMPLALGFGAGGEARVPLGVTVAAGLFASTFLTLLVIPVAYTLVDQLQARLWRMWTRRSVQVPVAAEVAEGV